MSKQEKIAGEINCKEVSKEKVLSVLKVLGHIYTFKQYAQCTVATLQNTV